MIQSGGDRSQDEPLSLHLGRAVEDVGLAIAIESRQLTILQYVASSTILCLGRRGHAQHTYRLDYLRVNGEIKILPSNLLQIGM